jgi:hypothetical protein
VRYEELCERRPDVCQLTWSPDEKLYALRVQSEATHVVPQPSWHGLPLCRAHLIYEPFEHALQGGMRRLTTRDIDMSTLVSSLLEIERLGPVHVRGLKVYHGLIHLTMYADT